MRCSINAYWHGSRQLPLLQQLAICSFVERGHDVILWTYEPLIEGLPARVQIGDAREILPEKDFYRLRGGPRPESVAFFADCFQLAVLEKRGGWWAQMDVQCLRSFDEFTQDYVFAPHWATRVAAYVMKAPAHSPLMREMLARHRAEIGPGSTDWHQSMRLMGDVVHKHGLERYIASKDVLFDDSDWDDGSYFEPSGSQPSASLVARHWCNTNFRRAQEQPVPGSYYHTALSKHRLIPARTDRSTNSQSVTRIAVVTPVTLEPCEWVEQCLASVDAQTRACTSIVVVDGTNAAVPNADRRKVFRLQQQHHDWGNAARLIGAISAIDQGFDAVAWLDGDNWFTADHLESLLDLHRSTGAAICTSGRMLHALDGNLLGPCYEVDGERFVDTNCFLIFRPAFALLQKLSELTRPETQVGDRLFWQHVVDSGLSRAHSRRPTVAYRTSFKAHYEHFGRTPPAGAKDVIAWPTSEKREADRPPRTPSAILFNKREKVSLCMIARDSAGSLGRALASVQGLVDEILVFDTGSADETREIARDHGAVVVDLPWQDDFSQARNQSLERATGHWVLWMDSDEYFDEVNRTRLIHILQHRCVQGSSRCAFTMRQVSHSGEVGRAGSACDQVRLFPRVAGMRWQGRVHEDLTSSLGELRIPIRSSGVQVQHDGYADPTELARKRGRNLRLLKLDLRDHPNRPRTHYYLGVIALESNQIPEAIERLEFAWQLSAPDSTERLLSGTNLARALRLIGRCAESLQTTQKLQMQFADDPALLFEEGLARRELGDLAGAEQAFLRLLSLPPTIQAHALDLDLQGCKGGHNLAHVYREQKRHDDAESLWRTIIGKWPNYLPSHLSLAELLLLQRRWAEVDALLSELKRFPHALSEISMLDERLQELRTG